MAATTLQVPPLLNMLVLGGNELSKCEVPMTSCVRDPPLRRESELRRLWGPASCCSEQRRKPAVIFSLHLLFWTAVDAFRMRHYRRWGWPGHEWQAGKTALCVKTLVQQLATVNVLCVITEGGATDVPLRWLAVSKGLKTTMAWTPEHLDRHTGRLSIYLSLMEGKGEKTDCRGWVGVSQDVLCWSL